MTYAKRQPHHHQVPGLSSVPPVHRRHQTYKNGGNWYSSYAVSFGPHEKNNWTYIIPRQETDYNKGITSTSNE